VSIVLGYDESPGSRPALEMVISLATRFDEPLVLVYGVEPPSGLAEEFQAHQRALTRR
jgi:Universal stress protein family